MSEQKDVQIDEQLKHLYEDFAAGQVSRRDFMRRATAMGVAGAAAAALGSLVTTAEAAGLAQQTAVAATKIPLDVAEWSYMWVNVKRAETARGAFVGGQQMYVEYMIPAQVRHPFPVVLVHGGGGQGTDWLGTPDGRPGWFQYLVSEGFKVYVVDRPGHGRSPIHPELHGGFPAQALTLESIAGRFTPPSANPANAPNEYQKNHNQWPGPGNVGSDDLGRLTAGHGWQLRRGGRTCRRSRRCARSSRRGRWWSRPGRRSWCRGSRSAAAGESAAGGRAQRTASDLASGRGRAARQDRAGDHHDALGGWSIRIARRGGASDSRQGDDHHRGCGRQRVWLRQPVGSLHGSGDLRSAGQRSRRRSRRSGWPIPNRAWPATTCRRSRRASCRI